MELIPSVLQAIPGDGRTVYLYFNDGSVRKADISDLIQPDTVFAPLRDRTVFTDRMTVMNGTVAWDLLGNRDPSRCIDLDPIAIYESSEQVLDPLAEAN